MRPPGLTKVRSPIKNFRLLLATLLERAGARAPFRIRIAPPGSRAGTGRIDQNKVRRANNIAQQVVVTGRCTHLNTACTGSFKAIMDRREPPLVAVGRKQPAAVFHRRRQRQRLAAGAGAEVDHRLAGLRARHQRHKLGTFVLHFDQPFEKGRLGLNGRTFGIGFRRDAQPDR